MGFFGGGGASVDLASPPAIGNTTPNTGAFTTLSATPPANTTAFTSTGYSITGTNAQSFFDLSGTWNTTGTPAAFKLNVTDTASNASSLLMDLQVGGTSRFRISKNGMIVARDSAAATQAIIATGGDGNYSIGYNNGAFFFRINNNIIGGFGLHGSTSILSMSFGSVHYLGWQSGAYGGNTDPDLKIFRDGAGILAQRNSTNAQTFRLYNTFTDASNYERGFFRWNTNVLEIGAEAAGTGTLRNIRFYGSVGIGVSPSYAFHVGTSANTAAFGLYASNNSGYGVADMAGGFYGANIVSGSASNPYYALNIVTGATVSTSQWSGGTSRFKVNSNGNIDFNGLLVLAGGVNFSLSTATGTKIGTATNQLLGFYNATPVDQPATVTDPTGGLTVDAEARSAINAIIDRLQELGLIA